jgi:hypothetical protein
MPVRTVFLASLIVGAGSLLLLTSCESERPTVKIEEPTELGSTPAEIERNAIERDIAALAAAKDQSDAKASKDYDDARAALIRRGSAIETTLVDNLRRADDWGIRLGLIEVLMATGTKVSIDHLIFCLDDDEPLVALRANTTLQEMTNHNEIPPAGGPTGSNGLPPVPLHPATDLALDAELRQWATWHRTYAKPLRAAWADWWAANKAQISIK